MRTRIAMIAAATMLVLLPAARSTAAGPPAPTSPATGTNAANSTWITVESAQNLVGRTLRDPAGSESGKIHSLVVDLSSGRVLYAIVGTAGTFDIGDKYVAVPFSSLGLAPNGKLMNSTVMASALAKAPRVSETTTSDFGTDTEGTRILSVRQDKMLTLGPGTNLASSVRGADVKNADGSAFGSIDKIIIDSHSGRIAYLLLSSGGFLGMGGDWFPVPAQAIAWSDSTHAFTIRSGGTDRESRRHGLQKGDIPVQVQRAQLGALYREYGLTPGWQPG